MSDRVDTERWHRADGVFTAALELPTGQRLAFVRERCAADPDLLREVEALLHAESGAGTFLDNSGGEVLADALAEALADDNGDDDFGDRAGRRVGPYRLIAPIDRGGMADVYLAERADGAFEQRVAVKIQRRGLDARDMLARFRAERQILSNLDHPNIARLLDGGATDDGRPYLVMEYVEGLPILRYCGEHRLSVPERLRLFIQVARAVQAAHAQLVVHRDIKPSNVLVTAKGEVRLLDFGIAKLLDPDAWPESAPRTRTGFHPLTPEYASPEQVRGDPITTASDIYQLGLLLYRLLTGGRPFNVAGPGRRALEEAITDARPTRPSSFVEAHGPPAATNVEPRLLARRLRGDLDTIVLAALRKEPERRYASAHEMAEDVRRHLDGRPIAARQESRLYRFGKFTRRNPWAVPAAVATVLALGFYIGTLIRHGEQLEVERNSARLEAQKAQASQDFLVGLFRSADPFAAAEVAGPDMRVRDVMEEGLERARTELAGQPAVQAELLGAIAEVYAGLGEPVSARDIGREALAAAARAEPDSGKLVVRSLVRLVGPTMLAHSGRSEDRYLARDRALFLARRAVDRATRLTPRDTLLLALAESTLGRVLFMLEYSSSDALEHLERAERLLGGLESPPVELEAEILSTKAQVLSYTDGPEAGIGLIDEALSRLQGASYREDDSRVAILRSRRARILSRLDAGDARTERRDVIADLEGRLGPDHDEVRRARLILALDLMEASLYDSAAAVHAELMESWRNAEGTDGLNYGGALYNRAWNLLEAGRPGEAAEAFQESADLFANQLGPDHIWTALQWLSLARASLAAGRYTEAAEGSREAHRIYAQLDDRDAVGRSLTSLCLLGSALSKMGRQDEAATIRRTAVVVRRDLGPATAPPAECDDLTR